MNLRPHRRETPDINLTPLIDVVFLLLIFFMVSTTFREDGQLRLQLPEADVKAVPAETLERVEVTVDRDGDFYVDQQRLRQQNLETLKQALVGVVGAQRDVPIVVRADAEAQHQAVMTVLDAAGQLGMTGIAFAASRSQPAVEREDEPDSEAIGQPMSEASPDASTIPAESEQ